MATRRKTAALVLASAACGLVGLVAVPTPASADAGDVVIAELMYHAPDTGPAFEFLELANRGTTSVDLAGWRFSVGITLATPNQAFPAGAVINAGERLVGTSDLSLFQTQYGFAADFSFAGTSLSNGGEQVTLVDASSSVVDSVNYDDASPWPVSPDGGGPSLELVDLAADNALAASWLPSTVTAGTPKAINSVESAPQAGISELSVSPTAPGPGVPVTVSARLTASTTANLTYKVMYGSDVTLPMLDDAASLGGEGDGVFSATISGGAGAGELIRYRIDATRGTSSAAHPPIGDSRPFDGVVVSDPELDAAKFPVLQWFMSDATYQDMITNHRCDGVRAPAAFVYNGRVLDAAMMRIKGSTSCQDPKAKWDVELPAGYTFDFGAPYPYPLKKFDMQSEAVPTPRIGWEMIAETGEESLAYQTMRIQRNGDFFGVFGILENYDGTWRNNNGYPDATVYEVEKGGLRTYATAAQLAASADLDKKNPEDGNFSDIWGLTQVLSLPESPAKTAYLREHLDLPQMVNYTAVTVVMRHWDSGGKNYYLARSVQTGRWQVLSWDLDGIFSAGADNKGDFIMPTTTANYLWKSLMADPQILAMHFRRVRELHDRFLVDNQLVDRFDQLTVPYASDIALDVAKWGTPRLSQRRNRMVAGVQERRDKIAAHTNASEIPVSQTANPEVVISEIQYHPTNPGAEFLELHNPSATESVDMSDWTIPALGGYSIQPGTVLPPGEYMALVKDDATFVSAYGGDRFVAGQYSGSLDDSGELVEVLDGARVVDAVAYAPSAPWPTAADGTGPSLELVDMSSDNGQAASWAPSEGTGTPAGVNSVHLGPVVTSVLPAGSTWRYDATGGDLGTTWQGTGFDDSAWSSGAGALGFRNQGLLTAIPQTAGRVTYYFRTSFSLAPGDPIEAVELSLLRDDGAVVYINGAEVARSNMPAGPITFTLKASSAVDAAAETQRVTIALPPSALATGTNVVAVEVHQRTTAASADLSFDASLSVTR